MSQIDFHEDMELLIDNEVFQMSQFDEMTSKTQVEYGYDNSIQLYAGSLCSRSYLCDFTYIRIFISSENRLQCILYAKTSIILQCNDFLNYISQNTGAHFGDVYRRKLEFRVQFLF